MPANSDRATETIWLASSLPGATIIALGNAPPPPSISSPCAMGARNASVLPLPVCVETNTSFMDTMAGHARSWTGRGHGQDNASGERRLRRRFGSVMPMSSHLFTMGTTSAPSFVPSSRAPTWPSGADDDDDDDDDDDERMPLTILSACSNVRNISLPSSSRRGADLGGSFFLFFLAEEAISSFFFLSFVVFSSSLESIVAASPLLPTTPPRPPPPDDDDAAPSPPPPRDPPPTSLSLFVDRRFENIPPPPNDDEDEDDDDEDDPAPPPPRRPIPPAGRGDSIAPPPPAYPSYPSSSSS